MFKLGILSDLQEDDFGSNVASFSALQVPEHTIKTQTGTWFSFCFFAWVTVRIQSSQFVYDIVKHLIF